MSVQMLLKVAVVIVVFVQSIPASFCQEKLKCVVWPNNPSFAGDCVWLQNTINESFYPRFVSKLSESNILNPISISELIVLAKECEWDLFNNPFETPGAYEKLLKRLTESGSKANIKIDWFDASFESAGVDKYRVIVTINFTVSLLDEKETKKFEVKSKSRTLSTSDEFSQLRQAVDTDKEFIVDGLVDSAYKTISDQIALMPYQRLLAQTNSETTRSNSTESHSRNEGVPAAIRDKWALIVGISDFQDKRIPKLKYSAKDARDFRDFLVKECNFAPDHVRLLLNEKATERRVSSELGNKFLARVAKPGDLIVLYFSTHGSSSKADLKGKNYLVAYDSDRDDLYATGIEMQKISDAISERVDSGRVLLVLDACHSGATSGGGKAMSDPGNFDAEELAQGSGKLVICSSKPDQLSWESARYQNGVFTRKLIDGLRLKGKKTKLEEAFTFVESSVKSEVQEDHAIKQEPVLRSKWDGSGLLIAVPPSAPQALPQSVKNILEPDSSVVSPVVAPRAIQTGKSIRKR